MPAGNVIRLVVAAWDLNVVSAWFHCSSFTPICICLLSAVRVRTERVASCVSTPSAIRGDRVCRESLLEEARWSRRVAGASTRVDTRSTCAATTRGRQHRGVLGGRARQFWFRSGRGRRPRVEDAGPVCRRQNAATKSADGELQMANVLDGRSVLEP